MATQLDREIELRKIVEECLELCHVIPERPYSHFPGPSRIVM
jgi:hypothetical protein